MAELRFYPDNGIVAKAGKYEAYSQGGGVFDVTVPWETEIEL